jgi:gas vesicle protein
MQSFLMGFTAGVGLGLLFAPRCGSDARSYLRRQGEEARESALDIMDRSKDAMLRQIERLANMQTNGVEVYQR